jgi:hypothetical protein
LTELYSRIDRKYVFSTWKISDSESELGLPNNH